MTTSDDLITWLRPQLDDDHERQTLDRHVKVIDGSQDSWAWFTGSESESAEVIKQLAMPYADRPGYRDEWRPQP